MSILATPPSVIRRVLEEGLTAPTVHDAGRLLENVAESGEDSEDEWNYFKGDMSNKENVNPALTIAQSAENVDTMSQLNPDAAEFVPISPTGNLTSPIPGGLLNDPVISQSPRRFVGNIDMLVHNV